MNERRSVRWLRRRVREELSDNQWALPAAGVVLGWLLALVVGSAPRPTGPWAISVDRSRDTMAGSLALVFTSLSIVLALASVAAQNVVSRFGSRALRVYLRQSPVRLVIATFAMSATFIVTEQFQLRAVDGNQPALPGGVIVSVVLLLLSGSLLIWYIGRVVRWFRVDQAVAGVMKVTKRAARAVQRRLDEGVPATIPPRPTNAVDLLAPGQGHLAYVDTDALLERCRRHDAMAVVTHTIGAPMTAGEPIGWIVSRDSDARLQPEEWVAETIDVTDARELAISIEYGLIGLVDIAIIALSPAVNDPNSAVEVLEEMGFLFQVLSKLQLGPRAKPDSESWPRVVIRVRTLGELVELATAQIVLYGRTDPLVVRELHRLAQSLRRLELDDADQAYVDAFEAKLEGYPSL